MKFNIRNFKYFNIALDILQFPIGISCLTWSPEKPPLTQTVFYVSAMFSQFPFYSPSVFIQTDWFLPGTANRQSSAYQVIISGTSQWVSGSVRVKVWELMEGGLWACVCGICVYVLTSSAPSQLLLWESSSVHGREAPSPICFASWKIKSVLPLFTWSLFQLW